MKWETVIGLEVHIQLKLAAKLFSGAATAYGAPANTQACAIDLGLPGVLPVLNATAVKLAVKFGLAVGAEIAPSSVFARKNYFYPDLPKGYQISQYELPIVKNGKLIITLADGSSKEIRITRAHLEEDAGKSFHENHDNVSEIDLNRAGIALIEVVSEPDLRSAEEAVAYLKTLHALVRYLQVSDANMEEGMFRCDANVSVRPVGTTKLGTRTEIKNINSFKFVEQAINYEVDRQIAILEAGGSISQETRLFNPATQETKAMRSKEEAMDYRYFPDPDLLPIMVDAAFIRQVQDTLPELPQAKLARFQQQYNLSEQDAQILTATKELADFFETTAKISAAAKLAANWIMVELLGAMNKHELALEQSPISAEQLGALIKRIADQTISGKIAKTVFDAMWRGEEGGTADAIIAKHGLQQITDTTAIEKLVDEVIANNPAQVKEYCNGKEKVFGFFVGQVLKASKGKANPEQVNAIIKQKLQAARSYGSEPKEMEQSP